LKHFPTRFTKQPYGEQSIRIFQKKDSIPTREIFSTPRACPDLQRHIHPSRLPTIWPPVTTRQPLELRRDYGIACA